MRTAPAIPIVRRGARRTGPPRLPRPYDDQLRRLVSVGQRDTQELFFSLALDDVREAAKLLRPEYDRAGGADGFISFECTPDLTDDTDATIAQATDLWQRLARPNVMIKVPGTTAGLPAIEELTRQGVNVNSRCCSRSDATNR